MLDVGLKRLCVAGQFTLISLGFAGCMEEVNTRPGDTFRSRLSLDVVFFSATTPGIVTRCPYTLADEIIKEASVELENPAAASFNLVNLRVTDQEVTWSGAGRDFEKRYFAPGLKMTVEYEGKVHEDAPPGDFIIHLNLPRMPTIASQLGARPSFIKMMDEQIGLGKPRTLLVKHDTENSVAVGILNIHQSDSRKWTSVGWKYGLIAFFLVFIFLPILLHSLGLIDIEELLHDTGEKISRRFE